MNPSSHSTWKSRFQWIGYLVVASVVAHLLGCWLFLLTLGLFEANISIWESLFYSLWGVLFGFSYLAATWAKFTLPLAALCTYLKWNQNLWLTTGVGLVSGVFIVLVPALFSATTGRFDVGDVLLAALPGALVAALFSAFTREWGAPKSKLSN